MCFKIIILFFQKGVGNFEIVNKTRSISFGVEVPLKKLEENAGFELASYTWIKIRELMSTSKVEQFPLVPSNLDYESEKRQI